MYKYNLNNFCNIISNLRKNKLMTQSALADRIGVSSQSVSKWECGIGYPDVTLFPVIADVLQVPIGVLFDENEHVSEYNENLERCFYIKKSENIKVFLGNICRVEFIETELKKPKIEVMGDKVFLHYFDIEQQEDTLIINVKNPSGSKDRWNEYDRFGYEAENIVRIYTGLAKDITNIECINYLDLKVSNSLNINDNYEVLSGK